MARFGMVGPSYESQSVNADAQALINWYPELIESGRGKNPDRLALYPRPGLAAFAPIAGTKNRGQYEINGRVFTVVGTTLWEVASNGATTGRGNVVDDGEPASFASSDIEVLIASGGSLYVFTLATNVLSAALSDPTGVSMVSYIDGFFLALLANNQRFRISTVYNAASWPGAQIVQINLFAENVQAMRADHRELWLLGSKRSVVYYDSGSSQIFEPIPGSLMEYGTAAKWSVAKLDNSLYWLSSDEQGAAMVWRSRGYTPERVSNHAIEAAISGYSVITDAIGYGYQEQGHAFYVLYFPTADRTWTYDVATQMWSERLFWTGTAFQAHRSRNHVYAFGKHLVGDRSSGNIYEQSLALTDDFGNAIRYLRRSPHVADEHEFQFLSELSLDAQMITGGTPDIDLRFSLDGGTTYGATHTRAWNATGPQLKRVSWKRLGRSRDRVFEISTTARMRIIDAFLR